MWRGVRWVILLCCARAALGLLCYNCSSTQHSWSRCAGVFAPPYLDFNGTRKYLVNCSGEHAMCFVRSWSARAKHAWIVQRGCYHSAQDDPVPLAMTHPTRAMTCSQRRLSDADYRVCLCKADWCNSGPLNSVSHTQYLMIGIRALTCIYNVFRV